jgi:hypothetical protein
MPEQVAPVELFRTPAAAHAPSACSEASLLTSTGQADKIHDGIRVATARLALLSQTAGSWAQQNDGRYRPAEPARSTRPIWR